MHKREMLEGAEYVGSTRYKACDLQKSIVSYLSSNGRVTKSARSEERPNRVPGPWVREADSEILFLLWKSLFSQGSILEKTV